FITFDPYPTLTDTPTTPIPITTLANNGGAITGTQNTFNVASTKGIEVNEVIQIDSEKMTVTGIDFANSQLTVQRTSGVIHDDGASVGQVTITVPITNLNDITNTLEYDYNPGIMPGDQVTYNAVAGKAIGGLVNGHTYTDVAGGDSTNSFAFQLKDNTTGNIVQLDRHPTVTTATGAGGKTLNFNVGTDPDTID